MSKSTKIILGVVAGIFVLLFSVVAGGYAYINDIRNNLVQLEISLTAEDQSLQAELDNYLTGVKNNLTFVKFDTQEKKALASSMIFGVFGGQGVKSQAFLNSFNNLYPELKGDIVKTDRVFDALNAGRERFKNSLQDRADKLRNYKTYRESNIIRSLILKNILNAPTENLKVIRGGRALTGRDAEAELEKIVSSSETKDAMSTGTIPTFQTN